MATWDDSDESDEDEEHANTALMAYVRFSSDSNNEFVDEEMELLSNLSCNEQESHNISSKLKKSHKNSFHLNHISTIPLKKLFKT